MEIKTAEINNRLPELQAMVSNMECDGSSRILSYILTKNKIEHELVMGIVYEYTDAGMRPVISLHCWIELEEKVLDLKLRMWTDENAPEGLFKPKDEGFYYKRLDTMEKPSKALYDILVASNKNWEF